MPRRSAKRKQVAEPNNCNCPVPRNRVLGFCQVEGGTLLASCRAPAETFRDKVVGSNMARACIQSHSGANLQMGMTLKVTHRTHGGGITQASNMLFKQRQICMRLESGQSSICCWRSLLLLVSAAREEHHPSS